MQCDSVPCPVYDRQFAEGNSLSATELPFAGRCFKLLSLRSKCLQWEGCAVCSAEKVCMVITTLSTAPLQSRQFPWLQRTHLTAPILFTCLSLRLPDIVVRVLAKPWAVICIRDLVVSFLSATGFREIEAMLLKEGVGPPKLCTGIMGRE